MNDTATSPIADLSYRGYEGPLLPPRNRWWTIAKTNMSLAVRKKGFWIWAVLSGYWYYVLVVVYYFVSVVSQQAGQTGTDFLNRVVWKDQFVDGFAFSQLLVLVLVLLVGAGTIANDNRANALLMILSKPVRKIDYVLGKWLGVFVPVALVIAGPTLLFYLYGVMSFRGYGFLSDDPWLIVRLVVLIVLSAAFHASAILAVSSLFKQGRLAGAAYAGIYFITNFMTQAFAFARASSYSLGDTPPKVLDVLWYASIDGVLQGVSKIVLDTPGSSLFNSSTPIPPTPIPPPALIGTAYLLVLLGGVWVAWKRVQAVEVVR